ncbi:MAG TPA: IclR family transcriptional regulator [Candidatus Acidoferrales bacterium]|jgi:DNA-binding IclR family transcriptional regulator|nr:IclR family transcriptional regulator [Candidatus Acidoferrales bacterium]
MAAKKECLSPAVDRALSILEAISEGNSGLTNAHLARRLGIPKSSACSILSVLQERGYLCRFPENGRYKLGFQLLTLGRQLLDTSVIRDLALPLMRDLVDRVDLTCHLAILGHQEAVHYEKIAARRYFKQDKTRAIGDRVPLHASSVGKALLAWQTPPALDVYLPGTGLRKSSPRTITDRSRLLLKLEEVRKQGYAIDDQECRLGWRCVGAPIFDQWGSTRVAICLTGTVVELDDSKMAETAVAVKETAQKISRRLASEHVEFATY